MKYLSLILLFALMACKGSQKSTEAVEVATERAEKEPASPQNKSDRKPHFCQEITEMNRKVDPSEFSTTNILDYSLIENCICIKYQYSGCQRGEPTLSWNGEWNSQSRPRIMMKLLVSEAGQCEQLLTDSTCFSIKKLKLVGNEVMTYLNKKENSLLLDLNDVE